MKLLDNEDKIFIIELYNVLKQRYNTSDCIFHINNLFVNKKQQISGLIRKYKKQNLLILESKINK